MVREDLIEVEVKVKEILLNIKFIVELDNGYIVVVYVFGKICIYNICILFGDKVIVELLLYDLLCGCIIYCKK